ncbi:MAG: Xaa-Pro peptidase family protein [Deltaproteobacteria bacterium]|nr:Xaa-Pro peptidase family protein [Deltaproteobacteria bacterium]
MGKNLIFTKNEYQQRVRKTKEMMDKGGVEMLLVMDPANMNYLTGYDGWSFYVHQGVIVSLDAKYPLWFGREQDSNGARLTSWLPDDCIYGYPDEYVQSRYTHTMRWVADLLREKGLEKKRFGLEMDGYWFNARMYLTLLEELPRALLMDGTNLVNWVKTVKSQAEIAYMKQAAQICEQVMQIAIDEIDVGVWEKDVAAKVSAAQIAGTDEFGGSSPAIFPIMPSAERTSTAHLTFDPDRRYQKTDVVLLELSGARHRYHAPLSRTVYLGDPPEDLLKTADGVVKGLQETLTYIQPGLTAEEVEECWRHAIAHTGLVKPSRVGYSYGLNYVPDWGEHTVSLRPGDKTILVPGMTLHFMPGIWLQTYGFECSEPLLITENGCEKFIEFPQKLFAK